MARLGLRAGEVAALSLDSFDWHAGEVVVHGKGKTAGRLPLPVDVGQAVVAYLRRRALRESRRAVFLYVRAPYQTVKTGAISALAKRALRAAGISSGAAHRLRHTAATMMLRSGASLTEISQVLRHRHISTTTIYAKVDHEKLRTVAQPWPGEDVFDGAKLSLLAQPWPGGEG
jgi:site-specific recombinase XerD